MDKLRTILKITCAGLLILAIAFFTLMMYGKSSGEKVVTDFFSNVNKVSAQEFKSLVDPALHEKADPELIQVFFQALQKEVGTFQGLNLEGMSFSDEVNNGVRTQEFQGNFRFEKKEIPMGLDFVNGLLIGFEVKDKDAFQKSHEFAMTNPPRSLLASYQQLTESFWKKTLTGDCHEAFDMIHENLQKNYGRQRFAIVFNKIIKNNGKLEKISFTSCRPKAKGSTKYIFFFNVDLAKPKNLQAHSIIEFVGFKGYILGFEFPSEVKP